MTQEPIGFKRPKEPTETWEKRIGGQTFVFTKTREKPGVFLYGCECRGTGTSTSVYKDRDLSRDEIERLPQFADFVSSHKQSGSDQETRDDATKGEMPMQEWLKDWDNLPDETKKEMRQDQYLENRKQQWWRIHEKH